MKIALKLIPFAVFLAVAAFLAKGLTLDPSRVPSPFIDKPAPVFTSARLPASDGEFDSKDMLGQVWVLNIWASWCAPCVQEHPIFIALANQRDVPLVGLNYKDMPDDALAWLDQLGDPFTHRLADQSGDVGLDWGVYGVPETFVIDRNGVVRYKHVGPLAPSDLDEILLPIIDELAQEPA
jgi:cytochrome c biogenesis protein CcmG/thiol:disulfide interchange protein DsbE